MQLYFDFRETATRAQILDTLLDAMDSAQNDRFTSLMDKAVVPDRHCHNILEVDEVVDALDVPDEIKEDLHGVYGILAAAEAKVHGCDVKETHFHEVGNASGIRNALAICAAFYVLQMPWVTASPVQPGSGKIECAHGTLDIPAPATAAILETGIPLTDKRLPGERCTPTSAAIIKHFVNAFVSDIEA